MICADKAALRSSFRKWVNVAAWNSPFSATLTLRQSIIVSEGDVSHRITLTDLSASQNFRHFLNKLNRTLYGKSAQRFSRGAAVVPVLEGGNGKRFHYHAVIDCPRSDLVPDFPMVIADAWRSTQWGYNQTLIEPGADRGWLNYMTKFRDKSDFATSIDWMNIRLP